MIPKAVLQYNANFVVWN